MNWKFWQKKPVASLDPVFKALVVDHKCPDCGGGTFLMGPHGGMAQNIKCANTACGSEFNCAPFDDGQWCGKPFIAERIIRSEVRA